MFAAPAATEDGEDGEDDDEDEEDIYGVDVIDDVIGDKTMLAELRKSIDALIAPKWPKSVQNLVNNFRAMRYPSGNPFAVKLRRAQEPVVVPDVYFDIIQSPLDLFTIKERVNQNYYVTVDSFIRDIALVADNALTFNAAPGPLNVMSAHLKTAVDRETDRLRARLS